MPRTATTPAANTPTAARTASATPRSDSIAQRVTAQIIAALEHGVRPWLQPWATGHATAARELPRRANGLVYRGLNTLTLWAAAEHAGYSHGLWGTYRCWAQRGAQVRAGERATPAVFWQRTDGGDADDSAPPDAIGNAGGNGNDNTAARPRTVARRFALFNSAQVDNYSAPATPRLPESARLTHADAFIAALHVPLITGGDTAYYSPATDTVHLPPFTRFTDAVAHSAVAIHEHAHASGAPHRLHRDLTGRRGTPAYAREELVAELTASFILADLGLAHTPRADHASYLAHWLDVLTRDPRALGTAAAHAQRAADWMHAQQPAPPA